MGLINDASVLFLRLSRVAEGIVWLHTIHIRTTEEDFMLQLSQIHLVQFRQWCRRRKKLKTEPHTSHEDVSFHFMVCFTTSARFVLPILEGVTLVLFGLDKVDEGEAKGFGVVRRKESFDKAG